MVLCTLPVDGAEATLGRLPGGGPHFSREMGKKRAGASPLDPGVHGRSFPLAGFWVGCLWCVRGAISSGMLRPIWDAFSRENMLESILRKKVSKSGHVHGFRNSPSTGTLRPTTPKPASGNERALKKGGQGAKPPALFPPAFSGESRAPARSRAGNHVAGPTLRRSRRHHLPTAARQSRSRLPPNQKGRPQGLPFSPIPCYALVTVFRMPLPAVSLGLVSKPSFS